MPILQWLFKPISNTCSRSRREQCNTEEETIEEVKKSEELVTFDKGDKESEARTNRTLTLLLSRNDSRACFYTTLVNFEREQYFGHSNKKLGLVKMGQKYENVTVGCKVLPICDIASIGIRNAVSNQGGVEKDAQKRRRAVSKMKELVRWAAAANKTGRAGLKAWKVLYFRNKMALKDDQIDDASSNSSKISFRLDAGSCSTSSSVFSPISVASAPSRTDQMWAKNASNSNVTLQSSNSNSNIAIENLKTEECNTRGQWITSDSDFVVLEL